MCVREQGKSGAVEVGGCNKNKNGRVTCLFTFILSWQNGQCFEFFLFAEKLDESECLTERPSLGRRHHVLNGQGFELLALAVKGYSSASDFAGTRLEQKFLDYTGLKKLNKQEVHFILIFLIFITGLI